MNFAHAHAIARSCTYVAAGHCAFDAAKIIGLIETVLHDYPTIEPALLCAATIGLVWHVVIHHTRLAILLAASHAFNLAVGWLHLALSAHLIDHSWHSVLQSPIVYLVLAAASVSVIVELATRRMVRTIVSFRRWLRGRDLW
ncbi:hypothetical protein DEM27_24105 [Metarhizobium album]|uniref:Uncharacterized protein n=1 Tax=Metarhizobium album TaxID=2182425 RepID=A0A2U2DJZ9_9HYPH|nr:hypothetical protein DEM27_24105 [Rhizobium album]